MLKLIVSDFDGTLMPYGTQSVSESVKDKINTLLKKNVAFAISSGRTYNELLNFLPEFADKIYYICCDGAHYIKNNKSLYEKKIESDDLYYLARKKSNDNSFIFHTATDNYLLGNIPLSVQSLPVTPISRIEEITEKVFKITSFGDSIKLPPLSGLRLHWEADRNSTTQYVNRFADKGNALSDLQTRLMLTKFDTVCIGDSANDIPMMRHAKYSFSIGNRCSELLKITNKNVDSIESALVFCLNSL